MKRIRITLNSWNSADARVELEDGTPLEGVEKVEVLIDATRDELPRARLTFIAPIIDVCAEVEG